ncbi:unnamed protein product [Closterium sp. Naga37s-1]|nr:unnamed protein product [Closterium sp. Naga37s-1]
MLLYCGCSFPSQVATLWSIHHTNLQRLLGYCWEKPGIADSTKITGAERAIAYSAAAAASVHAVEQAEEQVLVFEWVPGGNLHSRLVAAISCVSPLTPWSLSFTPLLAPHVPHHTIPIPSPQAVLAGCMAVKMGDPLPSIPATAPPASPSASAAASVSPAVRLPANHAYMEPTLHASARTTPTTDVFSIGIFFSLSLQSTPHTANGLPLSKCQRTMHLHASLSAFPSISSLPFLLFLPNTSIKPIPVQAHHLISRNITANLRAAHLPHAPDAIVLPMVRLALSCTASDPLSRPTVTDLLRSIKALKRSLSAHPRPPLPGNEGASENGDTPGAAGGGGPGEQQGGEAADGLSGGFSQNALDAKLDWLMGEEDSGRFVTDV